MTTSPSSSVSSVAASGKPRIGDPPVAVLGSAKVSRRKINAGKWKPHRCSARHMPP